MTSHLPVDRGWAWMVMLGSLINTACITTFMRSTSFLFIAFLETYQESATLTTMSFSWFAVMFAVGSFLQPVWFLPRFTVRSLTLAGSAMNVSATLGLAFSPNIILTSFLLAVIGFSCGFFMVPQLALIGMYFKTRLSLAASGANLGLSIATIAGPPVAQFLIDSYGLQGGLLLLAGINLHCVVGSMLLRPVAFYDDCPVLEEDDDFKYDPCDTNLTPTTRQKFRKTFAHSDIGDGADVQSFLSLNLQHMLAPNIVVDSDLNLNASPQNSHLNLSTKHEVSSTKDNHHAVNEKLLYATSNSSIGSGEYVINHGILDRLSRSVSTRFLSNSSFVLTITKSTPQVDVPKHQIANGFHRDSETKLSRDSDNTAIEKFSGYCSCCKRMKSSAKRSVFSNPYAILLIVASGVGLHAPAYYSYTPVLGQENGLSKTQIPFLLTVAGIADLLCKLTIGYIADFPRVRRIYLVAAIQLVFGITLQFVTYFQGLTLMLLMQVIGGVCAQVLFTLLPAITADILGPQSIGHVMSGYYLVNGVVSTVDHILVGVFKDVTGSFAPAFNYMGVLYLFGFALLVLEPFLPKKHRLKHNSEMNANCDSQL